MAKSALSFIIVGALALGLTGCSEPNFDPEGPPSPAASAPLNAEQQEAQEAVEEFFAAYDEAVQDPDLSLEKLAATTDGAMKEKVTRLVEDMRSAGVYQSGAPKYELVAYRDTFEEKGEQRLGFEVCTDSSGVQPMDIDTREFAPGGAAPIEFQVWRLLVAERDGWKVIDGTNQPATSCS